MIALQWTGDPGRLSCLRPHLVVLAALIEMLRFEPSVFCLVPGADDSAAADRHPGGLSCLHPHLDSLAALIQMLRIEPSI